MPKTPNRYNDSAAYARGVRKKLGLSQSQFAEASGVALKLVQDYEQGRSRPGYDSMRKYQALEQRAGAQDGRDTDQGGRE